MDDRKNSAKNDLGFTILEIVVVTVLLSIGAAVSAWSLNQVLPGLRLKSAIRDLKSDMQMARIAAIRQNTFVTIAFNVAGDSYTLFFDNGGGDVTKVGNLVQDAGEPTIKTVQMHPMVDMTNTAFGAATDAMFNAIGTSASVSGRVVMKNDKDGYRSVTCSRIGSLQIQESSDNGSTWYDVY